jgi:methylmalonyl-CoA mutase, N-terminal domain
VPIPIFRVNEAAQQAQIAALHAVRSQRDGERVSAALAALHEAALGSVNLMPFILDAVEAYASVGEIAGTLAQVFGEHREVTQL